MRRLKALKELCEMLLAFIIVFGGFGVSVYFRGLARGMLFWMVCGIMFVTAFGVLPKRTVDQNSKMTQKRWDIVRKQYAIACFLGAGMLYFAEIILPEYFPQFQLP